MGAKFMAWKDIVKQDIDELDISELEKIVEELEKASQMHASQAKRIREFISEVPIVLEKPRSESR